MINYKELIESLSKDIVFTKDELDFFISHLTIKRFKKRQLLVQAGNSCQFYFFINKGLVKEYFTDINGKDFIYRFVQENDWSSDYESYLNQTNATLNIEAIEDTEVVAISRVDTSKTIDRFPTFERCFRIYFQDRYSKLQKRLFEVISKTAEQRYAEFLAENYELSQRIAQHQIAAYLGVSAEFISKIRQRKPQQL